MLLYSKVLFCLLLIFVSICKCEPQGGPDPWNNEDSEKSNMRNDDDDAPPDIKMHHKKPVQSEINFGTGEWFFRRILAIVLNGGQVKKNDDDSVDVSLQMKFDKEHWKVLVLYLSSNSALTEEMFRRSVGYIQEAIYKPTVTEQIVMVWSDYIQLYLTEYKVYITWTFGILGALTASIWLWNRISHRHLWIIAFILLYMYEVFISYKEVEQQELEKFLAAVNTCKWYFWTSTCETPPPDPIVFLKHMNPLKIGIRMFTTLISEPMITISATVKTMIHGIVDGLWFPFDKIVYGILILTFNTLLIFLLIIIVFNFIFNIPFKLNAFGLFNIGVGQRNRTFIQNSNNDPAPRHENVDRISGPTLDKLLNVFSHALTNAQNNQPSTRMQLTNTNRSSGMRKSASTGRLPNFSDSFESQNRLAIETNVRKREYLPFTKRISGSGDAR